MTAAKSTPKAKPKKPKVEIPHLDAAAVAGHASPREYAELTDVAHVSSGIKYHPVSVAEGLHHTGDAASTRVGTAVRADHDGAVVGDPARS